MLSIAEIMEYKHMESLKGEVEEAANKVELLLLHIQDQYYDPSDAPFAVVSDWDKAVMPVLDGLDELRGYIEESQELFEFIERITTMMDDLNDRFEQWQRRKVLNTKEAAEYINRSRSSVYYWIKTGKLKAEKINGRWKILV